MAGYQKKRLALDSNLLLDLARGLNFAHDFHAVFKAAKYSLMAGPTVFRELGFAVLFGGRAGEIIGYYGSCEGCEMGRFPV